jgi:hypothetical protein
MPKIACASVFEIHAHNKTCWILTSQPFILPSPSSAPHPPPAPHAAHLELTAAGGAHSRVKLTTAAGAHSQASGGVHTSSRPRTGPTATLLDEGVEFFLKYFVCSNVECCKKMLNVVKKC